MVLDAQFAHRGMARVVYFAAVRKREIGTTFLQQQNRTPDRYATGFGESVPPGFEFVRNLDFPRHYQIIT